MKCKHYYLITLALLSLVLAVVAASPAQAAHPGYVYSTDDKTPAHDMDGHCIRTTDWKKEDATRECNPELLPAQKVAAPAAPAPAPVVKRTEGDSDGDGVPDSRDKCPNTPAGVKVDDNGCPMDIDNDGVPDSLDKCPDTPAGVKVDANGCPMDSDHDGVADYLDKCADTPAGVKVDANGCPPDSDHDGVADYLDKCADTPAGAKVDANGCPLDSDHDGVPDYLDKCPGTPAGAHVDKDGCVESITLSVYFDSGKSDVRSEYYPEIEKLATYLKQYPEAKVEIQGHTDNVGDPKKNKALSQRRAQAILDVLVQKYAIEPGRLAAKGFGEEKPLASNKTKEGKEKNRRVEAVIMK